MRIRFRPSGRLLVLGVTAAINASLQPMTAGTAHAESLSDALALAYSTNPALRAQQESARAADEGIAQARGGFLPTVTITGQIGTSWSETLNGNVVSNRDRNLAPENATIQFVQPVFRGGRSYFDFRRATAAANSAHASYRSFEQDFLLQVISVYMEVRRSEAGVEIRKTNIDVLSEQVKAAKARLQYGDGTITDVAQAEARLSGGDAGLSSARAELDAARAAYERIVGQTPGALDPAPNEPALPATLDDAIGNGLAASPEMNAAKLNADAARYAIGVSRAALLPEASIVGQAGVARESSFINDRIESSSIVARVTIPLFDAGVSRSQLRQSKIERYRADALEEDTRRRVIEAVSTSWSNLLAARAVSAASRAQVTANESAFEGVRQEQAVGLRTALDVLDAQQELLESQLAAVNAERDAYIAAHRLLAATGGLTIEALNAGVGSYNPDKYMRRARRTFISTGVSRLVMHEQR